MKFCKDCRWCEQTDSRNKPLKYSTCEHPKNLIYYTNLVTGKDTCERKQSCCSTQRLLGRFSAWELGRCGKSGRWFEKPLGEL